MNSYEERLTQAEDRVEIFVELSECEKTEMLANFIQRVIHESMQNPSESKANKEKGQRLHIWLFLWCQMKKAGWDMNRRDVLFFANIQRPITTLTKEIQRQMLDLQVEYLIPAAEAEKQGKHGKAARLEELYLRQIRWIDHILDQG